MPEKKELQVGDILPPKQLIEDGIFYRRDKTLYCLRPKCEGCQYDSRCKREEVQIRIGPGINIRQAFRARPGFKWVSMDFKGIELRVAAQMSGEPVWVAAFQNGLDLHREMAKVMFKTADPLEKERDIAKRGNFGNLYLASIETFWGLTDLTYNEAAIAHKKWWAAVPVYAFWVEHQKAFYRQHKYVETFFKRRREMADLMAQAEAASGKKGSKKKIGWGFCDRTSVNSVIQGGAADLMKAAMVKVVQFLDKEKLNNDVKMFLTVHDELDFEFREQPGMYEMMRDVGRVMTFTPKGETLPKINNWKIPIEVDIEVGDDWGNLQKLDAVDPPVKEATKGASPLQSAIQAKRADIDQVVLEVSSLREEDAAKLHFAIFNAANTEGVVKVPLRFQMGDRVYKPENFGKVSSDMLKKGITGIPGIRIL